MILNNDSWSTTLEVHYTGKQMLQKADTNWFVKWFVLKSQIYILTVAMLDFWSHKWPAEKEQKTIKTNIFTGKHWTLDALESLLVLPNTE